jgi:hypothetical protein
MAALALVVASYGVLVAGSTPRRVGDGVEYWAMADQLRRGRPPSASAGDLARLRSEAVSMGRGFDQPPLTFPLLVGVDGRQDFPHFWLYSLVNVPALAVASALGVHPNWAFTATNLLCVGVAFWIVAGNVSIPWALLLLAGPIAWWIDKAHSDVFTVSLLSIACASWTSAPTVALVCLAAAGAQNPALMPVWAMSAAAVMVPVVRRRARPSLLQTIGILASTATMMLPLVYYKVRLGVWSPLVGYTHPGLPSPRTIVSLLLDPNIGLVPNAPFVVIAIVVAIVLAARAKARGSRAALDAVLAAAAVAALLVAFAQSININHGATPGLNRWLLWLPPWTLLVVSRNDRPLTRVRTSWILPALAAVSCAWTVCFFRPSLPEMYRYPTATAAWLWTNAPGLYAPAPEIFAERVSHREPPRLPAAWPGCTKVLLLEGRWPDECPVAAPAPPACLGRTQLCYATPDATGRSATFTTLGPAAFPFAPAPAP